MAGDSAKLNILTLSDDELLDKVQEHGFSGPIVDSTRSLYQKMLIQILEGSYKASPDLGDSEEEEDERPEPEESLEQRIHQPSTPLSMPSFQQPRSPYIFNEEEETVRHRVSKPSPPRPTSFSSDSSFLHSGSPYMVTSRPSLSSVSGKQTPHMSFSTPSRPTSQPETKAEISSSSMFSKAKLLIAILVVLMLAFVFYQNMEASEDSNPVPKIRGN